MKKGIFALLLLVAIASNSTAEESQAARLRLRVLEPAMNELVRVWYGSRDITEIKSLMSEIIITNGQLCLVDPGYTSCLPRSSDARKIMTNNDALMAMSGVVVRGWLEKQYGSFDVRNCFKITSGLAETYALRSSFFKDI